MSIIRTKLRWSKLVRPYVFATLAIGASTTTGDFICQYLGRHSQNKDSDVPIESSLLLSWWDRKRSLVMCESAVFVTTPWVFTISRVVERLFPGKQGTQITKKIIFNAALSPIGISLVFLSVTLLKGQSFHEAATKVKTDMPKTFLASSCYWPFISFINFRYISLDYRPFIGSIAAVGWNIYISLVANKIVQNSTDTQNSLPQNRRK